MARMVITDGPPQRACGVLVANEIVGANVTIPADDEPSAVAVAAHYQGLAHGFVFDQVDSELRSAVSRYMTWILATQTLMRTPHDRQRLAEDVLNFIGADCK